MRILLLLILSMVLASVFSLFPINMANALIVMQRVPGVRAGDWTKYAFTFNYSSNNPNLPEPPYQDIDYYKLDILTTLSTNITLDYVLRFRNGTEITSPTVTLDVNSGVMSFDNITSPTTAGPLIGANLTAGDQIYMNPISGNINSTTTGKYAGRQREVNILQMTQQYGIIASDYYIAWDRISGIFVALNQTVILNQNEMTYQTSNYTTMMHLSLKMTETNIWQPTPPTSIPTRVFIAPKVMNLKSHGKYVLAIIELPKGYRTKDINLSTITLNGTITPEGKPIIIGKQWLLTKFDRDKVINLILSNTYPETRLTKVQLTITGQLSDGKTFQGSDTMYALPALAKHRGEVIWCAHNR